MVAVTFKPAASGARTGFFGVIEGSASAQILVSGTRTP
jgi:hypothetical protein